jgi:pathogenesis-related protein 1
MKSLIPLLLLLMTLPACDLGSGGGAAGPDVEVAADMSPDEGDDREPAQMAGMTQAHNEYRLVEHDVALVWNSEIAAYAQEWAEYLRDNHECELQHRSWLGMADRDYGENLYGAMAWGMALDTTPQEVVDAWWSEIEYYDYDNNSCTDVCGHYTQLMWKGSTEVGCGVAFCNDGQADVWVCNYSPPGNWVGMKPW